MVYVDTPKSVPELLLVHPCSHTEVGEDVGSLFYANELNIICIKKYSAVVDNLIIFNNKIGELGGGHSKQEADTNIR